MSVNLSKDPGFGKRHIQYILIFCLHIICYATRYNMSIAIVAMTQNTSVNTNIPFYDWPYKNIVLSSFFWGYIIPQIPAGNLGIKFGSKKLLLICMTTNSFMIFLIPIMAEVFGANGVMACRVIQGLSQGFFYPLISNVLGKWVPVEERARIGAFMFSGSTLGLVLTYSITGFLCKSSLGWPSSFYFSATVGFIWSILYYFLGSNDPASHNSITKEERLYIEKSLGTQNHGKKSRPPWRAILTSIPLWAIFFTSLGHGWGSATVLTEMPTYFDKVLKFDISSNGMLSSLPYLTSFFVTYIMGFSSDYLINKKYLSITNARKLFTAIGSFGTGSLLLIFGYLPEHTSRYLAVAFLVASISIHSAVSAGYNINHYDLSPNFSGTLMGLINEGEELLSIITPLAVHFIVTDETNRNQWKLVITMGSCMYFASAIIFGIFARAERQWWNEVADEDDEENSH